MFVSAKRRRRGLMLAFGGWRHAPTRDPQQASGRATSGFPSVSGAASRGPCATERDHDEDRTGWEEL